MAGWTAPGHLAIIHGQMTIHIPAIIDDWMVKCGLLLRKSAALFPSLVFLQHRIWACFKTVFFCQVVLVSLHVACFCFDGLHWVTVVFMSDTVAVVLKSKQFFLWKTHGIKSKQKVVASGNSLCAALFLLPFWWRCASIFCIALRQKQFVNKQLVQFWLQTRQTHNTLFCCIPVRHFPPHGFEA